MLGNPECICSIMTLEDFFTLTEIKDGLTAPARVKELVCAMQKEKDCTVKNVNDATRQWSTVASTIAATEDKDCLDLFVQLGGLWFIDRWLKDSQKFGNDASENFVEESITALLCALEKLHVYYEKSISNGLWMTVKDLLGHSSSRIQERARALFESWKQNGEAKDASGTSHSEVTEGIKGSADLAGECALTEGTAVNNALHWENANEEKHVELTRDGTRKPMCLDDFQSAKVDLTHSQLSDKEKNLVQETLKDESSPNPMASCMITKPANDNLSVKEDSLACQLEQTTSIEACTAVDLKQDIEESSDFPVSNRCTDKAKQIQVTSPPIKLAEVETSYVSGSVEPTSLLCDQAGHGQKPVTEADLPKNTGPKDECDPKVSPINDVTMEILEKKSGMVEFDKQEHNCNSNVSLDSSGKEDKVYRLEDPDSSSSTKDSGSVERVKEHASDESDELESDSGHMRPARDFSVPDVVHKRSDVDVDYSMVDDALEVARQVAIEVEREVMGQREPSGSSFDKISDGIRQSDGSKPINGKEIQTIKARYIEAPSGPNKFAEASPKKEELLNGKEILDAKSESWVEDTKSCQVRLAIEPEINTGKALGDFDLNEGVCSDDVDPTGSSISAPIPVISASRAAASPGLPVSPIKFEGAQEWKGSASTSAFRSASPWRIVEVEQNISKQQQNCLDFDLNVSEAGDDKSADLTLEKQALQTSGLAGSGLSVQAGTGKSDTFKLDLNQISTESNAPLDWPSKPHPRNGHQSPSPSSSSASMQPSLKNIDLNDQPSFNNDYSDLYPHLGKSSFLNLNSSGGLKMDGSVISLMGARVEVNPKEAVSSNPFFSNGRILGPALDVNLAIGAPMAMGPKVPYAQSSVFGYTSHRMGPTAAISSNIYGPPFLMGMTGASLSLNNAGPSRSNLDLNLMTDVGNRETGGLRLGLGQLFNPGQSRLSDEPLRASSLPFLGSGGARKRKEPDGGWEREPEPFLLKHKQDQPPWK
ncbi:hypothetical protein NMG60_11016120 [Bertholletia excelsa]